MLKFKGSWRSYQRRILDALNFHLSDKKLHVIAAPGAGKTTLGIEVISRINKPTLILCPTNTIKNQWYDRICNSFLEPEEYNIVSTRINEPKFITITTYQALLAAFCGTPEDEEDSKENDDIKEEDEEDIENTSIVASKRFKPEKADDIIKILNNAKISLLCFDEAHHLRKEWWKALTYLVENLNPKQTIALTATPPYDVNYGEWQRYEELCGEIDEVISIPELVKNGDLCPHQDFIHFSLLRKNEKEFVKKYDSNVETFIEMMFEDNELLNYLHNMPFLNPTDKDIEKIFDNPDFYISIVSFLHATGRKISKEFLKLFDAKEFELPKFNYKYAKIFLNGFLYKNTDEFKGLEEKIIKYTNTAKRLGLIQNKRIVLADSRKIQKQISGSLGKLDSIIKIVELEKNSLGNSLRMVILADYIKANDTENLHLGVVPIWRTVKSKFNTLKIGVLCGSLIILPVSAKESFYKLLDENNIAPDCVSITTHNEDNNFIKIIPKESAKHCIVSIITELFNRGAINILTGTQALLGEGWDAPCINSLILSSTVSSYMLSNQMRGRAIRIDKNNPDKISNIWHLASVKLPQKEDFLNNKIFQSCTDSNTIDDLNSGLYDIQQLQKRFEGFEAPSYFGNHEIVNGLSRIFANNNYMLMRLYGEQLFVDLNKNTMALAKNRQQTKNWWQNGLNLGYNKGEMRMQTGIDAPKLTAKTLCFKGYEQIFYSIIFQFVLILFTILNECPLKTVFDLWFIAFVISFLYLLIKYLRTGTIEQVMKQIAIVHLETLSCLDCIKTSAKNAGITTNKAIDSIFVSCKNLPADENNLLISAMKEFLDPIENPRYLLIRQNKIANFITQTDYFAIPSIISSHKDNVELFKLLWNKYIGSCEIVYTRNLEGRKLLLKARKIAFSASKRESSKKISRWG